MHLNDFVISKLRFAEGLAGLSCRTELGADRLIKRTSTVTGKACEAVGAARARGEAGFTRRLPKSSCVVPFRCPEAMSNNFRSDQKILDIDLWQEHS